MPLRTIGSVMLWIFVSWLTGCSKDGLLDDTFPESNRFTREVLIEGMDEPMQLEFDTMGRVYWIQRTGGIRRIDPASGITEDLGEITTDAVGEAGLLGFLLAPDFAQSGLLYVYYSFAHPEEEMRLSRFRLADDRAIDPASEVILLRWPADLAASHMGGGMAWDNLGNLYLSTGDNSDATQYTPIHWANEGGRAEDAQRTAANTNDLRGKILRIHPEADGTYSIPANNLFVDEDPQTRPEIYTMGNRNPWRLAIDAKTGFLHWGEVGPDAGADSAGVGPRGYDEFNAIGAAANLGWPYFVGYNRAYNQYDRAQGTYGPPFDPLQPVNHSENNTGKKVLPPAQGALLAYPYAVSDEFKGLGSGGRNAVGGPVFYTDQFEQDAARVFPAYFEGRWFVTDFVRNWIMVLSMNEDRTAVTGVERFMPEFSYNSPIDMDFGPEGDLYVLEYGTQWFVQNEDARLTRIVYNRGNRPPVAMATTDQRNGAVPLQVTLSAGASTDPDGDPLAYSWTVIRPASSEASQYESDQTTLLLEEPGTYKVALSVTDSMGASAVDSLTIIAGNTEPEVEIVLETCTSLGQYGDVESQVMQETCNTSFHFPEQSVAYNVHVRDKEDGELGQGIEPGAVQVTWEYVPAGVSTGEEQSLADLAPGASARHLRALELMQGSDCYTCHRIDETSAGPAYMAISERYRGDDGALEVLSGKIVSGGSGVWGEIPMPAHPGFTPAEARVMAEYVLDQGRQNAPESVSPIGQLPPWPPVEQGAFVLRAVYPDRGGAGAASITVSDALVLRHPFVEPQYADTLSGAHFTDSRDPGFFIDEDGGFVGFYDVDLTGIDSVFAHVMTRFYTWSHFVGGTVEVRLDAVDGPLIGEPLLNTPPRSQASNQPGKGGDNAPGAPVFFGSDPVGFDVSSLEGKQTLYFVFRNSQANGNPLFLLEGVAFRKAQPQN